MMLSPSYPCRSHSIRFSTCTNRTIVRCYVILILRSSSNNKANIQGLQVLALWARSKSEPAGTSSRKQPTAQHGTATQWTPCICWTVQIMKLVIMQFFLFACHFGRLRSTYYPPTLSCLFNPLKIFKEGENLAQKHEYKVVTLLQIAGPNWDPIHGRRFCR